MIAVVGPAFPGYEVALRGFLIAVDRHLAREVIRTDPGTAEAAR